VWTPLQEHDVVCDISPVMSRKKRALQAHHSQLEYFDYLQGIEGLNAYRGALSGRCKYAEVFLRI